MVLLTHEQKSLEISDSSASIGIGGCCWLHLWIFSEGNQWSSDRVEALPKILNSSHCVDSVGKSSQKVLGVILEMLHWFYGRGNHCLLWTIYVFFPLLWSRPRQEQSTSHPAMALNQDLTSIIPWIAMPSPYLIPVAILTAFEWS